MMDSSDRFEPFSRPWRPALRLVLAPLLIAFARVLPASNLQDWRGLPIYALPTLTLMVATGLAFATAFIALCLGRERVAAIEAALGLVLGVATVLSVFAAFSGLVEAG